MHHRKNRKEKRKTDGGEQTRLMNEAVLLRLHLVPLTTTLDK
jgi:hypothetical protein